MEQENQLLCVISWGIFTLDQGKVSVNDLTAGHKVLCFKSSIGYVPGKFLPDVSTGADFLKIQAGFKGMKDLRIHE